MSSLGRRRLTSSLTGGLSGAGAGAQIGTVLGGPGIGTAIGAGVGLLAGALTPDDGGEMTEAEKAQIELEKQRLAEDQRQFGLNFGQKQFEDQKNFGFAGLDRLAAQRTEATGKLRKYNFRNAVLDAARGA